MSALVERIIAARDRVKTLQRREVLGSPDFYETIRAALAAAPAPTDADPQDEHNPSPASASAGDGETLARRIDEIIHQWVKPRSGADSVMRETNWLVGVQEAAQAIADEIATLSAPTVGEGWRLVPVEPTAAMIDDGAQRLASFGDDSVWPDSWNASEVMQMRIQAERVIRSAICAAPAASGWKLVPLEATPEMYAATVTKDGTPALLEHTTPEERSLPYLMPRYIYRAMLSASPAPTDATSQDQEG